MAKYTEWSDDLAKALAAPFPVGLHAQKDKKGTFVAVQHYVARLNALVGPHGWSMPAPVAYHAGSKLGLAVGVTVLGVTKWNVGDEMEDHGEPDEDGKTRDFGSSSTNSWAQAFKRCCAYGFGMGLYLYDKNWTRDYLRSGGEQRAEPRTEPVRTQAPAKPKAEAASDTLATPQQLNAIGVLFDVHDIPFDERAQLVGEVNGGTMTYSRAKEIILHVQKLPKLPAEATA